MTAAETAAIHRERRKEKETFRKELLELMLMNLQQVLKDESISNESRLEAVTLINELRKELHL